MNLKERYTLPVLSLVTDAQNLFDIDSGIYVLGRKYMQSILKRISLRMKGRCMPITTSTDEDGSGR